jgi:peptidoglycan LD-endopeptidase LytH
MRTLFKILLGAGLVLGAVAAYTLLRRPEAVGRSAMVVSYLRSPGAHPEWTIKAGQRCGSAPFILPGSGFAGYLWDDSFYPGHRHQGIDIFSGIEPGKSPVLAAYDGYLTRLAEWKSSVIVRIPRDPLLPGRQIWIYYTHMADSQGNSFIGPDFPAGTTEKSVRVGAVLGYQGNYSGDARNPVGVHLHVSIVQDDGQGRFLNELEIENTLDPSPYFGMAFNGRTAPADQASICR